MKQGLVILSNYLQQQLKNELTAQGHIATKNLLNSIDVSVETLINGFEIKGQFLEYGSKVDTGTGPGTKVSIRALIDWIRAKKIVFQGKSELQTAFLIQGAIYRKGTPTDGNLNKKRWMSVVLERNQSKILQEIESIAKGEMLILFNNMIERTRIKFKAEEKQIAA